MSNLFSHTKSVVKTPSTTGQVRPAHEEMHPSKVRQSTTKQPDSGLLLGFNPVKRDSNGKIIKDTPASNTPSKTRSSPPSHLGTPKFLKFSTDDSQLSEEARKLMENVRGDVARIKAQMILEKGEQERKEREAEQMHDGRKIAKPKGKASRFSDAHMAEFRKMDSIAGHPSSFRATPGRFKPVDKSLKRKISKANLEEPEKTPSPTKPAVTDAKRVKRAEGDDTSITRPKNEGETPKKSTIPQPKKTAFRSTPLMTPMKASSSRFATAKPQKTSMIPSLMRSPESRIRAPPRTPQTEFNPKLKKNLPSLGDLRSILRRHQPLFSKDPVRIAAGTHVATPGFNPDIKLDDLPSISFDDDSAQTPSPRKRVGFTPSTKNSPSPTKLAALNVAPTSSDVVYPTLPQMTPPKEKMDTPTIRRVRESAVSAQASPFPNLPAVPHGIANKKRHRDEVDDKEPAISAQASPFPNFPAVPHGIANKKRHRDKVDDKEPAISAQASPFPNLRTVPHGIANKKRHRDEVDDNKDSENIPPADSGSGSSSDEQRSTKRLKTGTFAVPKTVNSSPLKSVATTPARGTPSRAVTPGTATSRKGRSVLSLTRLNMLAKPKSRR
jgi:hypothetical protein